MFIYLKIYFQCIMLVMLDICHAQHVQHYHHTFSTLQLLMLNMFNMSHDLFQFYLFHNICFFLKFLVLRSLFIMSKHHFDHFFLIQFILVKDIQMLSFCDHCNRQKKFCVIFNKFNKYSECICSKKLCSLFFSSLTVNVMWLFKIHEKIEKEQTVFFNEKQYLFEAFQAAEIKKHQLHCHAQFLHDHNDKLIQKSTKVFKKKLYVLKKKQNFIISLNNNSFNSLISEINADVIFSVLSDNFWTNLSIKENFSVSAEFFQDV